MQTQQLQVKANINGDLRRFALDADVAGSLDLLREKLAEMAHIKHIANLTVTYEDEEKDNVSLVDDADYALAREIAAAHTNGILRLTVGRRRPLPNGHRAPVNATQAPAQAPVFVPHGAPRARGELVAHASVALGTTVPAGATFTKTWTVRNAGPVSWPKHCRVILAGGWRGDRLCNDAVAAGIPVNDTEVPPGGEVDVSVELCAPTASGNYVAAFNLTGPLGRRVLVKKMSVYVIVADGTPQPALSIADDGTLSGDIPVSVVPAPAPDTADAEGKHGHGHQHRRHRPIEIHWGELVEWLAKRGHDNATLAQKLLFRTHGSLPDTLAILERRRARHGAAPIDDGFVVVPGGRGGRGGRGGHRGLFRGGPQGPGFRRGRGRGGYVPVPEPTAQQ